MAGDRGDDRFEPPIEPPHGGDVLRDRRPLSRLEVGGVLADVGEHPSRLVLAGDQPREALQSIGVEAVLDHSRHDSNRTIAVGGEEVDLLGIESEAVEPVESTPKPKVGVGWPRWVELLGAGQLAPEIGVAGLDLLGDGERVDLSGEAAGLL